jgi:hypothetical protein
VGKNTAKSLFDLNIQGAEECLKIYDGASSLGSALHLDWLLRSAVVLAVSAIDAYFHDIVRYRAGKFSLDALPKQFANLEIPLGQLNRWEASKRKGNVLRLWAVEHLAARPLQKADAIAAALKLVGIQDYWNNIEPDNSDPEALRKRLDGYVERRHRIAHEGDRLQSRRSGKRLRAITRGYAVETIDFIRDLVDKTEERFPS